MYSQISENLICLKFLFLFFLVKMNSKPIYAQNFEILLEITIYPLVICKIEIKTHIFEKITLF